MTSEHDSIPFCATDWTAAHILTCMKNSTCSDKLGFSGEDNILIAEDNSGKASTRPRKTFADWIVELKDFYAKHGHTNVTETDNKDLAIFVRRMKYARQNPDKTRTLLSKDRIASLDALQFDWTKKRSLISFEERLAALKTHKQKHGHLRISEKLDRSLASFCTSIPPAAGTV